MSDPTDPVHVPGYLGLVTAAVLSWLKVRERGTFKELKAEYDAKLLEHDRVISTLQTKDEAVIGRAELRADIKALEGSFSIGLSDVRADIFSLATSLNKRAR